MVEAAIVGGSELMVKATPLQLLLPQGTGGNLSEEALHMLDSTTSQLWVHVVENPDDLLSVYYVLWASVQGLR